MAKPVIETYPVLCQCGRIFKGYTFATINDTHKILRDTNEDVISELVKVCHVCGKTFHWHTKEQAASDMASAFERLMRHYQRDNAIIAADKSTG